LKEFLYSDLTGGIIGCAFEVYKNLGYGFLEKVYENAMMIELRAKNLKADNQFPIKVKYKGNIIGDYFADIFVEDTVMVELKTEKSYNKKHEAQLLNYLKATGMQLGLLLNFGANRCHPKRLVF